MKNQFKKAEDRLITLLKYSLGKDIVAYLEDDDVIEVIVNPDNTLWIDTLSKGLFYSGINVEPENSLRVIKTVATHCNQIVDTENSIISAELPESGSRFEGIIPPNVENPIFCIRKKGIKVFTLDDYISKGTLSLEQKKVILEGIHNRENFLIIGGTSTGKTTFANAVINEMPKEDRLVIIEDTKEIQSNSPDTCCLQTSEHKSIRDLLKSTMRLRPDRILVGEIRDEAGLDLITAWNSGHPGGISTIHSETALGGLRQLERYIQRVSVSKQEDLIADIINILIVLKRVVENGKIVRKVSEIIRIEKYDKLKQEYVLKNIL